jgi:NAD-dependent deacetylase
MRTIFFTGAGLSADSGIPTFRGPGGIYKDLPVEQWLTGENYSREPARSEIDGWYDSRRQHLATCEPNTAHHGIAEYARRHPNTLVMTQNVDDLLERAGIPENRVLHLHGSIVHLRCRRCDHRIRIGYDRDPAQGCPAPGCNGGLRTDVVLFGEQAPRYRDMWHGLAEHGPDDALVVIGTHGSVISIGNAARRLPGLRILNNLHPSEALDETAFDEVIRAPAAEAFPRIVELLDEWREARRQDSARGDLPR